MTKTGHFLLLLSAAILPILFGVGCKETGEEFSGLVGWVGVSAIEGAEIRIYDASQFLSLSSTTGLVAETSSESDGSFIIALPDTLIGKPLIVVADFPANQAGTVEDDRSFYIDYTAQGQEVRLDPEDGPWATMVEFFDGLDAPVTITPWTTLAFQSLSNLDANDVGVGNLRYSQNNIRQASRSVAVNIGLIADPAEVFPNVPDLGGNHPAPTAFSRDNTPDSAAYTYTLMQLDRAALAFATATTQVGDDQSDFYNALFEDAQDGVVDGRLNGQSVVYFASAGAPDVLDQEASGASKLFTYISQNGVVDASELALLTTSGEGFVPDEAELLAAQNIATGAVRTIRLDEIDLDYVPISGGVEVVLSGAGLLSDVEVVFASDTDSDLIPTESTFVIDADSDGNSGEITQRRHDQVTFVFPDFTQVGIGNGFKLTGSVLEDTFNVFTRFDYDGPTRNGQLVTRFVSDLTSFVDSGLHVLSSRVLREDTGLSATGVTNALAAGTDPSALNPATDEVYLLELTLLNATSSALTDATLDVASSAATNDGDALTLDVFGGSVVNPQIVFPSAAQLATDAINSIAAGERGVIQTRFVLDQAQLGAAYSFADLINIVPVASASSGAQTLRSNDVAVATPQVDVSLLDPDDSPVLSSTSFSGNATLDLGETIDLIWQLAVAPQVSAQHRSLELNSLTVLIERPAVADQTIVLDTLAMVFPKSPLGVAMAGLSSSADDGATGLPLTTSGDAITLVLSLEADATTTTGVIDVTVTANWGEALSGTSDTTTAMTSFTLVNP